MKKIDTYEEFNEKLNWKKALVGGAIAASMALGTGCNQQDGYCFTDCKTEIEVQDKRQKYLDRVNSMKLSDYERELEYSKIGNAINVDFYNRDAGWNIDRSNFDDNGNYKY